MWKKTNSTRKSPKLQKEISKCSKDGNSTNWKISQIAGNVGKTQNEKSNFTPNFYSMKDFHGNRVPNFQKPNALADDDYHKHCGPN